MSEIISIKIGPGSPGFYIRVVHEMCDKFKKCFANNKNVIVALYFVNSNGKNKCKIGEVYSYEKYYRSLLRLRDDIGRLIGIVETNFLDAYRLALLLMCDYVIGYSDTKIQLDLNKEMEIIFNRLLYSIPTNDFPLNMHKLHENGFVHELFNRKHKLLTFNEESHLCIHPVLAGLIRKLVDNAEQIDYTYKQIGIAAVYANTVCVTQFVSPLKMFAFHPYTTVMSTHLENRILKITFNGPLKYIYTRALSIELIKIIDNFSNDFDSICFTFDAVASDSDIEQLLIGSHNTLVGDDTTNINVSWK